MIIINIFGGSTSVIISKHLDAQDRLSPVGGAITGLFFGLAFYPRPNTGSAFKCKVIGTIMLVSFVSIFLALLLFEDVERAKNIYISKPCV
jgi:hypothetical protein